MFRGLITPCKECVKENCGLYVELTWKNEQTKEEKKQGECAILGIYGFLARMENRMIANQKVSEESRNYSAEALNKVEDTGLKMKQAMAISFNFMQRQQRQQQLQEERV